MVDSILSNCTYLLIIVLGLAVAGLGWPWVLAFYKHSRRGPGGQQERRPREQGPQPDGPPTWGGVKLERLTLEVLEQLKLVNENLSLLHRLIENNHLVLVKHQQQAAQGTNTNLLKLSMSYESFANTLQSLMQRNLDALQAIVAQAESSPAPQPLTPPLRHQPPPGGEAARSLPPAPVGLAASAPFDDLIDKIKDEVNQASYKGLKNVHLLLEEVSRKHPIRIDSPSDQVFILVDGGAQAAPTGRAFVLPGSYLGRPWIEWFEMPKGVFERVEGTVDPATVTKDANGDWSLVKPGTLSQQ